MRDEIKYHFGENHLLVTLGSRLEPRIRMLFFAEFLFTTGMATVFLLRSFPFSEGFTHWVAGAGAAVLYILAAYRFLVRMLFKEELMLDKHHLTITHKTIFSKRTNHYEWAYIGPLHYAGKATKTDHPLKGRSFDYLGFETQEHLIQSLHQDGNLYFNYYGSRVYFARGVYSWHAEEMIYMMRMYAGASLRLGPEWEEMLQETTQN